MEKKVTILSIDGGGIRGILPAVILEYLEKKLREKTGNENARLADFFDMIAGTSTGGILSCLYIHPDRIPAERAVDLYAGNGKKIFRPRIPFLNKVLNIFASRYPAKGIEKALNDAFGDSLLSQAGTHSLITAYDIERRRSVFFTVPAAKTRPGRDYRLKDIARATSAAPTYFEPASVAPAGGGEVRTLVDGAMFANDPALCALVEARKTQFGKHANPVIRNLYMVSAGTGKESDGFDPDRASRWGIAGWAVPVVDILMTASPEVVGYQLKQLFGVAGCEDCYVRLNPGLCGANPAMDDASDGNIAALKNAGEAFVADNALLLDGIADELIRNN